MSYNRSRNDRDRRGGRGGYGGGRDSRGYGGRGGYSRDRDRGYDSRDRRSDRGYGGRDDQERRSRDDRGYDRGYDRDRRGGGGRDRYDDGGRGGYRGGGNRGYRGGGRGRGGRGRGGRGGGRGRGRGGGNQPKESMRWHEAASAELNNLVNDRELGDYSGPQQVRLYRFPNSKWVEVESLTKGGTYYFNTESQDRVNKQPAELRSIDPCSVETQDQGYNFPPPPLVTSYPREMSRHLIHDIVTNTFPISGTILQTSVYLYDVIFDPAVPTTDYERRKRIVLGDRTTARECRKKLGTHFGNFEFDNHALFTLGHRRCPDVTMTLGEGVQVTFNLVESYPLGGPDVPAEQQAQLLNVFNRKRLLQTGYRRINRSWFSRRPENSPEPVREAAIVHGFDCAIHVKPDNVAEDHDFEATFKADLAHKLVSSRTVHEILGDIRRRSRDQRDFSTNAERELIGKYFIMTYNSQNMRIVAIDWNQTEESHFDLKSGGRVTYKEYLRNTYNLRSEKREFCVIQDRNGAYYLPQHMRLTRRSDEVKEEYSEVLQKIESTSGERFDKLHAFVREVNASAKPRDESGVSSSDDDEKASQSIGQQNSRSLDMSFSVDDTGLSVDAVILQYPEIQFMGRGGPVSYRADELVWKETKGFLEWKPLERWGVVYDENSKYGHNNSNDIYNKWEKYCGMRGLRRGEFGEPEVIAMDLTNEREYARVISPEWGIVMVIIPDTKKGSQAKAMFTKYVSTHRTRNPILTQFILDTNCRNTSAVLGSFEDMLEKWGNVLFRLDPMFASKKPMINPKTTWTIGIDVSHVAQKPSVAMMHLNRTPLDGSLGGTHLTAHLNKERQEIIPFVATVAMTTQILEEAFAAVKQNPKKLPSAIFVYRDGVSDGQLRELHSKEITGIQRGIRSFQQRYGIKKAWKPKLEYICCAKSILDRFGRTNRRGDIDEVRTPIVVYDGVTNHRVWDFIMFPYHPKKRNCRNKRYIVLKDEMGLHQNGAWDLYQYTFALTYAFCFGIPFPLGGASQPAPIAYAKHYAENFSQMILSSDLHTDDLRIHKRLNRPHIVDEGALDTRAIFGDDRPLQRPQRDASESRPDRAPEDRGDAEAVEEAPATDAPDVATE